MKYSHSLALSALIFAALFAVQLYGACATNGGLPIYPLDDPYIHMKIARNLAFEGCWGINPGEFVSGGSSILYVLLLAAAVKLFGDSAAIPLALNFIAGLASVAAFHFISSRAGLSPFACLVAVFAAAIFVPLHFVCLLGMEHSFHIPLCLAFTYFSAAALSGETVFSPGRDRAALLFSSLGLGLIRYESLFSVLIAAVLLLAAKKFADSLIVAAAGVVPLALFGAFSVARGGSFLPNPVLLKGVMGVANAGNHPLVWLSGRLKLLYNTPFAFALVMALLFALTWQLFRDEKRPGRDFYFVLIALLTAAAHVAFAALGWFARYEAYLVALGAAALVPAARQLITIASVKGVPARAALAVLAAVLLFPFAYRAGNAISGYATAVSNIYQQQYQMALFVGAYYGRDCVAINDVGTTAYFTKARILDLYGLADNDVTRWRMSQAYTSAEISLLCRRYRPRAAMIYDRWFYNMIPASWSRIGDWEIQDNLVCGSPRVSFYATDTAEIETLSKNFAEFSKKLPEGVLWNLCRPAQPRNDGGSK